MRFTKMHGIGNDYVYVDCFEQVVVDPAALARRISHRHTGIGADGLILVLPSDDADVRMRMFNADGSEAQMCGNGIRCLAKYAFDHDRTRANPMRVETAAGVKRLDLRLGADGTVAAATVDMGPPILDPAQIPVDLSLAEGGFVEAVRDGRIVDAPITVDETVYRTTCVSMGNPHAVIFVEDLDDVPVDQHGSSLEFAPIFPDRSNVHFVAVVTPTELRMRTWERGSGQTLACGTGASAVCVAGVLTGRCERDVLIHLPGGDLDLQWREDDDHVYMTGPAEEVFSGDWPDV